MKPEPDFWERPDVVADFAARAADRRLEELLAEFEHPRSTRVLDVGCAGGRNTVLLAERGFDVHALDASAAMVAETRRRVASILGNAEARERIRVGRMDDLSDFADASVDLVVALGVLHNAGSRAEWERAAAEAARVLRPEGRLLVAHFSPETDLTGEGVRAVPGEAHVYDGLPAGRATLLSAPELDTSMARFGLVPSVPTTIGSTKTERGQRVSVNALYRKG